MNTSLGAFIVQGAAVTYGRSLPNYSSRNFPGPSGVPWYFPGVKRGHSQMAPFLWRGGPRSTLCRTVLPFWLKVDFGAMASISFLSLVVAPLGASPPKVAFSRHRAMPGCEGPGDEVLLQAPARAGPSSVGRRRNCSIKYRRGQSSNRMADAQTGF